MHNGFQYTWHYSGTRSFSNKNSNLPDLLSDFVLSSCHWGKGTFRFWACKEFKLVKLDRVSSIKASTCSLEPDNILLEITFPSQFETQDNLRVSVRSVINTATEKKLRSTIVLNPSCYHAFSLYYDQYTVLWLQDENTFWTYFFSCK